MPVGGGPKIKAHLWIVVTEPNLETQECVIVSVTTLKGSQDQTITLQPGDHRFIDRPSVVMFSDARLANAQSLQDDIEGGSARRHSPCSHDLISLVKDGVLASPHTPNKIEAFCRNLWGKPARQRQLR